MKSIDKTRKIAICAGILIILGIVVGILSIVPSVEGPDYLTKVFENQNQILTGAFFQFLLVPIYLGFALLLYPILRNYNKSLAIGFVSFRIIAQIFQLIGVITLPLFIILSQKFINNTGTNLLYLQTLGEILQSGRDLANHVGMMLPLALGSIILYYIFYKAKLIPGWLSSWGFIGNILAMLASFLILFNIITVISQEFIILTIPLVLQEIILAFWLIIKGFNPSYPNSDSLNVKKI